MHMRSVQQAQTSLLTGGSLRPQPRVSASFRGAQTTKSKWLVLMLLAYGLLAHSPFFQPTSWSALPQLQHRQLLPEGRVELGA